MFSKIKFQAISQSTIPKNFKPLLYYVSASGYCTLKKYSSNLHQYLKLTGQTFLSTKANRCPFITLRNKIITYQGILEFYAISVAKYQN